MIEYLHAGQFRDRFASLRVDYEQWYRKDIERIRAANSNNPTGKPPQLIDYCLEYHARTYIINGMFEALNWPLQCKDGLPALIPEAPVESLEKGTRRFLDYFGLSLTTRKPLIVIEAKRPYLQLPSDNNLPERITAGIKGDSIGSEWNEILSTLGDYIHSTAVHYSYAPHRAVITNGSWLILFLNPAQTFVNGNPDPGDIIVYIDHDEICKKAAEVWQYLEYSNIAGNTETRSYSVGDLPFCIDASKIKTITLGLRLVYGNTPTQRKAKPHINILPVVLIASQDNVWIYVKDNHHDGFDLPHKYQQLADHLHDVNVYSLELLTEVAQTLQLQINLSPITAHYKQEEGMFSKFRGVNDITAYPNDGTQRFILVTGATSHFLSETPSVVDCKYHVWNNAQAEGAAALDGPVVMASLSPKSFFEDNLAHHCTHTAVYAAKTSQLNQENRQKCGCRSNPDGAAFCEIIQFEEFLCCRTCVFESICTNVALFHLPCHT